MCNSLGKWLPVTLVQDWWADDIGRKWTVFPSVIFLTEVMSCWLRPFMKLLVVSAKWGKQSVGKQLRFGGRTCGEKQKGFLIKDPVRTKGEMEQHKSGENVAYFDPFLCFERHHRVRLTPNITGRTAELCRWLGHNHKMGINTWTKWVALCRSETDGGQVSSILSLTDPKNVSGPSPQPPHQPPNTHKIGLSPCLSYLLNLRPETQSHYR